MKDFTKLNGHIARITKMKFHQPTAIKNIIQENQLTNIIIETGKENVFIPEKNKFIVTKEFLKNQTEVFNICKTLNKINMSNFDLSEITTMKHWFRGCKNLQEIVFPTYANCKNLTNLVGCFSMSNIQTIDLSFMNNLNMVSAFFAFESTDTKKIVLPECEVENITYCFFECQNLEEIIAPIKIELNSENFLSSTFFNCKKLNKVDLSNGSFNTREFIKQIKDSSLRNNLLEDCIIILPDSVQIA